MPCSLGGTLARMVSPGQRPFLSPISYCPEWTDRTERALIQQKTTWLANFLGLQTAFYWRHLHAPFVDRGRICPPPHCPHLNVICGGRRRWNALNETIAMQFKNFLLKVKFGARSGRLSNLHHFALSAAEIRLQTDASLNSAEMLLKACQRCHVTNGLLLSTGQGPGRVV